MLEGVFGGVEATACCDGDAGGAGLGETDGDGAADASARAADEDGFACEVLLGWVDGWVRIVVDGLGDGEVAWVGLDGRGVRFRVSCELTWSFDWVRDSLWWRHCEVVGLL